MRQKVRMVTLIMALMATALLATLVEAGEFFPSKSLVTIRGDLTFAGTNKGEITSFSQLKPDGSTAPFSIPSHEVFVVTDVEWLGRTSVAVDQASVGTTILMYLKLQDLPVYHAILKLHGPAGPGPNIFGQFNDHLSAGFVINNPKDLKVEAHCDSDVWMWIDLMGYFSPK
jgi:hypothetical protein